MKGRSTSELRWAGLMNTERHMAVYRKKAQEQEGKTQEQEVETEKQHKEKTCCVKYQSG